MMNESVTAPPDRASPVMATLREAGPQPGDAIHHAHLVLGKGFRGQRDVLPAAVDDHRNERRVVLTYPSAPDAIHLGPREGQVRPGGGELDPFVVQPAPGLLVAARAHPPPPEVDRDPGSQR